jgi:hypothetical protein
MLLIAANDANVGMWQMEFRSQVTVALHINGTPREVVVDTRTTLLDLLRGSDGNQKGLQLWGMWRLHRAFRWTAREWVPGARGLRRGTGGHNDRGSHRERQTPSGAAGVH